MALSAAAQEAKWLQCLTSDLLDYNIGATEIFEDNQSAICLAKTPQFHGRTKHIEIKYHFIRDEVESGNVKLEYCRSEDLIADMLTKGLPITQFVNYDGWLALQISSIPPALEKECWWNT